MSFGWVKNAFSAIGGAAIAVVGMMQMQAQKVDDAVDRWRTENLAAFSESCPYIKTNLADYKRAWDRKYPYGDTLLKAFSENQKQYFADIDKDKAKACFAEPVKSGPHQ
jgi:hypothetical protein